MAVRTKQAIRQAFIELLNERPLDKISVKDIAERSTVNRNTFYYYYADIYALVEEIFQTETQLFMEKLHSYASWEEAFREATAFVSENKRAVHHLFNSGNRNILEHYYHKVTYAAMLSYVRGQAEGLSAAEEDIQALAQFYAAALSGMTADWLRGGMKSNVNDHIDRLGRLLEGNIRQALERTSDHCSNIAGCVIDAAQHNLNLHETLRAAHSDTHAFRSEFERYAAKYALPAPASAQ